MSFCNVFGIRANDKEMVISQAIREYFTKDLTYYKIPEGVTDLRSYCFYNFWPEGGIKVILPKSLKRIAPYAFSECAISEIVIPSGVEEICDYAFFGAPLKKLTIEEGVKRIGVGAFKWGPNIPYLSIPDSVEYIGENAFDGMLVPGGAVIEVGAGVKFIGDGAFACDIKSLVVHKNYGDIPDGSSGYFREDGEWVDPTWFAGYDNPIAIWDGDW